MSFGLTSLIPMAAQALPGLLSSFTGGGASQAPPRARVDYSGLVRDAVSKAQSEFNARLQQQSAATAQTLDRYRGTIQNLQNQLSQANQAAMFSKIQAAQSQAASSSSNNPPVVIKQEDDGDNKMILYGGIGLLAVVVLMQSR